MTWHIITNDPCDGSCPNDAVAVMDNFDYRLSHLLPLNTSGVETSATYDLVSNTYKWKDLYLSGNIVVGGTVDGVDVSALSTSYGSHDHSVGDPTQVSHADLTNVSADQHHAQAHALSGADHTGDLAYSQLDAIVNTAGSGSATLISRSDHAHTGADGSPTITVALVDHAHTAVAGQGGQLDWDNIWSDAVHSHGSNAEGGTLDWDSCWADAAHDHSSAGEGGTLGDWDYTSAQTRYYSVSPFDLVDVGTNTVVWDSTHKAVYCTGATRSLYTNLHLPNEATITDLIAYLWDNNNSLKIEVRIYKISRPVPTSYYSTGLVTSNGIETYVHGNGTLWVTNGIQINDTITFDGNTYTISNVNSETLLTITSSAINPVVDVAYSIEKIQENPTQTEVASCGTTAAEDSGFYIKTDSAIGEVIDNATYCYFLEVVYEDVAGGNEFCSAQIIYTTLDGKP